MKNNLTIHTFPVGQMQANCYIIVDEESRDAIIVDPGDDGQFLVDRIHSLDVHPTHVVATHGHFDHIMGVVDVQLAFSIPFLMHKDDQFLLDRMQSSAAHFLGISVTSPAPKMTLSLHDADTIKLGTHALEVIHTPGHTPGSISLVFPEHTRMIVGDTVFAHGGVGRTDFSYSRGEDLLASLKRILSYPLETQLFPGHGEETLVRHEKQYHGTGVLQV